jgi:hypothetical protein
MDHKFDEPHPLLVEHAPTIRKLIVLSVLALVIVAFAALALGTAD